MRLNFLPLLVVLLGSMAAGAAFQGQEHHYDNPHNIVAVLAAIAPPPFQRLQAWFHSTKGLVLLSIPRSLRPADSPTALFPAAFDKLASASLPAPFLLGSASSAPAFDDNGDLYFQRSLDDGNSTVLLLEDWVLPFNSKRISPVSDDEGVPSSVQERRASRVGIPQQIASRAPFKITVDPGHGGSDPGAVAQGYSEKDFTLDVSLRLRDLLLADRGLWSVQMTRSTDIDVSLTARTNMANAWPADRFVSIHINSFSSSSAQGTETYSYAEGSTAAKLRDRIQQEAVKAWGLVDRGSKTENFHVLRETTMPATLSELGFITSPVDIVKLSDPNARKQMAAAHLYALQYHMGVSFNLPVLAEDVTKED